MIGLAGPTHDEGSGVGRIGGTPRIQRRCGVIMGDLLSFLEMCVQPPSLYLSALYADSFPYDLQKGKRSSLRKRDERR